MEELQDDGTPVVVQAEENTGTAPELEEKTQTPDTGDQLADDETEPEHDKQPRWARKNITRLARQKKQLEDRLATETKARDEAERKAAELEAKLTAKPVGAMPKQDDFETAEDFTSAMFDWKQQSQEAASTAKSAAIEQAGKSKADDERFFSQRDKLFDTIEAEYGIDMVNKVLAIPGQIMDRSFAEDVLESDRPAEVLKYLAENTEETAKIAALPQRKRAIALGRIEARLTAPRKPEKSKAPPPVTPVSGASGVVSEKIPEDTDSLARWLSH